MNNNRVMRKMMVII